MASQGGYVGRIADVDLTTGTVGEYALDDAEREAFLGGKALAGRIVFGEVPRGTDSLGPDNVVVVNTGPLTGTNAPATSRFNVSTKSPLTGGIASANCGGDLGIALKRAGFDGLVLRGRAPVPSVVEVEDGTVRIKPAGGLWGQDTEATQAAWGKGWKVMCIGPAGENRVRYAALICGERAAARGGVGAVFGSKNLKALAARGTGTIPLHDKPRFKELVKQWVDLLKAHPITGRQLPNLGTAALVNKTNATHTLPTRNFRYGHWDKAEQVSGEALAEKHLVKNIGCTSCPIRCGRLVRYEQREIKGPEYETIGVFGPNIENAELEHIIRWNRTMDLLGLDTISAGGVIAFAMEAADRGLLDVPLRFGSPEGIDAMLEDIAYRRGQGDLLAEGTQRMAARLGGADFAMHAKGLEFAAYEPRGAVGHGLGYATANRGGCHINGGYLVFMEALGPMPVDPLTPVGKPGWCVVQQNLMEAISACGNCIFTSYAVLPGEAPAFLAPHSRLAGLVSHVMLGAHLVLDHLAKLPPSALPIHAPTLPHTRVIAAATGLRMDVGRFLAVGERGFNIERLFNLREGLTAADDRLPTRMTHEPQDPRRPETVVPLDRMLKPYYRARCWDDRGVPRPRKLRQLGLAAFGAP